MYTTQSSYPHLPCEQFRFRHLTRFQTSTESPLRGFSGLIPYGQALDIFRAIPRQTLRIFLLCWREMMDSNHRLIVFSTIALPTELISRNSLRCAASVASPLVRDKIQHTYCISPTGYFTIFQVFPLRGEAYQIEKRPCL